MKSSRFGSGSKFHARRGSTVVVVLGFIAVISMLFTAVLSRTMNAHRQVSHIASWQEALLAADAGGEMVIAEMRKTLFEPNAFAGWERTAADGTAVGTVPNGASKSVLRSLKNGLGLRYTPATLTHAGEGNTEMEMQLTIDSPPELVDPSKRQWFRVRATGTTYLPGAAVVAGDKRDLRLRRMSFLRNPKLDVPVDRPQTSRTVEMVVRPIGLEPAIYSREPIDMNNANIVVDSYDSRDSAHSTNGLYDPAKRGAAGDVATNSTLIDAGNASIYGNAFTNGGSVVNSANVHGEIDNEYFLEVAPVLKSEEPLMPLIHLYLPTTMSGGSIVMAGSEDNPRRYRLSGSGSLNITGGDLVFRADPVEATAGRTSYVDVWVPGDMKTAGVAGIKIEGDVQVRIYVEGSIYIGGNGNWNANSQPSKLQVFGVKYEGTGQIPTVTIAGNGIIVAAIYTPDHPVEFKATGSGGQMWGSIFGKSIIMGGSTHIHYDRALADVGRITDFRIKSWFEDRE